MIKTVHQFEYAVENKVCRLLCDVDMPIIMIKEALFQFQKHIGHIEDQALAQQRASQDQPVEENKQEENKDV